jgi:ribosomal protein S18 acetylase RimI-like enzyme
MAARGKPVEYSLVSGVDVRRAGDKDIPTLVAINFGARPDRAIFVADIAGEIAGVVSFAPRPFETEQLHLKTLHLDQLAIVRKEASRPLFAGSLDALAREGCQLVTARRPEAERDVNSALQAAGFQVIECLMSLTRPLERNGGELPSGVSVASNDDADGCAEVARRTFRSDRFHADPAIDDAAADTLKAEWARNSVRGRADKVFITRDNGTVIGFNACLLKGDEAVIDLIGVAPGHQGRGLGRALTAAAIAHYSGRAACITVGTQSCNSASLSLYQDAGFRICNSALTLHAHLS